MTQPQELPPFKWIKFFALLLFPPALSFAAALIWSPLAFISFIGIGTSIYCGVMLYRGIMARSVLSLRGYLRATISVTCCIILALLSLMLNFAGCMSGIMMNDTAFQRLFHKAAITSPPRSINGGSGFNAK